MFLEIGSAVHSRNGHSKLPRLRQIAECGCSKVTGEKLLDSESKLIAQK